MTVNVVVQEYLLRILSSYLYLCVCSCHPQTLKMVLVVIFIETPDRLWHYNQTLDSMFLMGQAQVCMYIIFCHPFVVSILCWHLNPKSPFDIVPLFTTHPVFAPPQLSPSSSMEINPFEMSFSSASASSSGGCQVVLEFHLRVPDLQAYWRTSSTLPSQIRGMMQDFFFRLVEPYIVVVKVDVGDQTQMQFFCSYVFLIHQQGVLAQILFRFLIIFSIGLVLRSTCTTDIRYTQVT